MTCWESLAISVGSGLVSGIIVAECYRRIDIKKYRLREKLDYYNQWSSYLSKVHFELSRLLETRNSDSLAILRRLVFHKPIIANDKYVQKEVAAFQNNITTWIIDLNYKLLQETVSTEYLMQKEKELLEHQKSIRNAVSQLTESCKTKWRSKLLNLKFRCSSLLRNS